MYSYQDFSISAIRKIILVQCFKIWTPDREKNSEIKMRNPDLPIKAGFRISKSKYPDFRTSADSDFSRHYIVSIRPKSMYIYIDHYVIYHSTVNYFKQFNNYQATNKFHFLFIKLNFNVYLVLCARLLYYYTIYVCF